MNQFIPESSYSDELEFTEHLSSWLDKKTIKRRTRNTQNKEEQKTTIHTEHQPTHTSTHGTPDIKITQKEQIRLEYRQLSDPFFIEAKIGREFSNAPGNYRHYLIKNLTQYLKYKYAVGGQKHHKLSKYGDYHVLITEPYFFTSGFQGRKFNQPDQEISDARLIRIFWHLGLGVLYTNRNNQVIAEFNESEAFYIE